MILAYSRTVSNHQSRPLSRISNWEDMPATGLKGLLWDNAKYSYANLKGEAAEFYRQVNVYPIIRHLFRLQISDMRATRELFKYHGVDQFVRSLPHYCDELYEELMEAHAYKFSPVWGLNTTPNGCTDFEQSVAQFVNDCETATYSIQYVGPVAKHQLTLKSTDLEYVPTAVIMSDRNRIRVEKYGTFTKGWFTYSASAYPLFMEYHSGLISWSELSTNLPLFVK